MTDHQNNFVHQFYVDADNSRVVDSAASQRLKQHILGWLEPDNSANFLDIGCYDGSKTAILAQYIRAENVYGTDFLSERLEIARERGIKVATVDLNNGNPLPFEDAAFDFIFCGDVIEHIYSPDHLLQEMSRLLCSGGYTIITTPNLASWRNRLVLLFGWQPFMTEVSTRHRVGNPLMPKGIPSGHIRMFTPRAMRELAAKYALSPEHIGGMALSSQPHGWISRTGAIIDKITVRFAPMWCDEMIVKLRKL